MDFSFTFVVANHQFFQRIKTGFPKFLCMDIWAILEALGILFGIGLGIIGAAPQIASWVKPKPYLVLMYYDFRCELTESLEPDEYYLHLLLENESLLWHRSHDATDVKVEWRIIDMNRDQCGDIQTFGISKYLPVEESANKRFKIRTESVERN